MNKILILVFCAAVFGFIFVDSHTLEMAYTSKEREGMAYYSAPRAALHWDRFWNYLERIPACAVRLKDELASRLNRMTR